jgi:CheY-like chemotaxis protein
MGVNSRSNPRVLIVDDEPALLQLMQRFVEQLGYDVEAAASGNAAWETFSAAPSSFALIIADMTLPDISGEMLLQQILRVNPSVRILVCSGYPADPLSYGPEAQVAFLQKPFMPRMLEEAVRKLMRT